MDNISKLLNEYLHARGPYSARLQLNGDFKAEFDQLFTPLLKSLKPSEQLTLVRQLGAVAFGRTGDSSLLRGQALRLLERLEFPWPNDFRWLLAELTNDLVAEFNQDKNLEKWASSRSGTGSHEVGDGPGYALALLGLALLVGARAAVERSVQYLRENAQDPRFRVALDRLPMYIQGLELTTLPPPSEEEYIERRLRMSGGKD